jgi:hypothetical protein
MWAGFAHTKCVDFEREFGFVGNVGGKYINTHIEKNYKHTYKGISHMYQNTAHTAHITIKSNTLFIYINGLWCGQNVWATMWANRNSCPHNEKLSDFRFVITSLLKTELK